MASDNPILVSLFAGAIPAPGRLSVAKGLLPLERDELLEALCYLRQDSEEDVRSAAQDSLFEFRPEELAKLGRAGDFRLETFSFIARSLKSRDELLESLLGNPALPVPVVRQLATDGGERLCDVIIINQQRLINNTDLVVALLNNPRTGRNAIRLLYELREQFMKERTDLDPLFRKRLGVDVLISQSANTAGVVPAASQPAAVNVEEALQEEDAELADDDTDTDTDTDADDTEEGGEAEEAPLIDETSDEFITAYTRIMAMNVPEKIKTALLGSREDRSILIRDTTKLVSEAVLDSPKLGPDEIRGFIRLKSLNEGLVRKIAMNKDWMKDEVVMMAVVKHPRTPNALVSSLLVRVPEKPLHKLGKDKEVSEVVRRTVRRFIAAKEAAKKKSGSIKKGH
jgi:hypothetical protein